MTKKARLTHFDPAELLTSDEAIFAFMADALESGDAGHIAHARGMREIARETGLSREQLDRSFSERGNPTLKTMLAVMKALGAVLTAKPMAQGGSVENVSARRHPVAHGLA
jgi:probable addiction module antidote protein